MLVPFILLAQSFLVVETNNSIYHLVAEQRESSMTDMKPKTLSNGQLFPTPERPRNRHMMKQNSSLSRVETLKTEVIRGFDYH